MLGKGRLILEHVVKKIMHINKTTEWLFHGMLLG
jgi:hypothetical protein